MTLSGTGRRIRFRLIASILFMAIVLAMIAWSKREGSIPGLVDDLRVLKSQRMSFARALDVLSDNTDVVSKIENNSVNVDSLVLSLIESLKQQADNLQTEISQLSVTNSIDLRSSSHTEQDAHFLRVEFSAVLKRATDLLWLFEGVREIADWRPMEVRGCSVTHRHELVELHAACTVDVYYFPDLDA